MLSNWQFRQPRIGVAVLSIRDPSSREGTRAQIASLLMMKTFEHVARGLYEHAIDLLKLGNARGICARALCTRSRGDINRENHRSRI